MSIVGREKSGRETKSKKIENQNDKPIDKKDRFAKKKQAEIERRKDKSRERDKEGEASPCVPHCGERLRIS